MRRFLTTVIPLGLLAAVLVGCGRGQKPIPPGAQQVHVVVTGSEVRLDPATVRAGDVYVVLDTPRSSVGFVERQRAATESPGPLSDNDLARLAGGDTEGTAVGGFSLSGCSDAQRAEDRGQQGYCGNVFKVVLSAGKYAFLGPEWTLQQTEPSTDPTVGAGGFSPPSSMAVLEVLP